MSIPSLRRLAAALLLCCASLGPLPAGAHAIVVAASPAVDGVVAGPRVPIELRFNSRIDPARSRLTLVRPDGTSIALAPAGAAAPDMLSAEAGGLAPGHYRLRWQVLGLDGHITRGDIPFTVAG
jgi:methionine-rich copper-binding protein CopC